MREFIVAIGLVLSALAASCAGDGGGGGTSEAIQDTCADYCAYLDACGIETGVTCADCAGEE